MSLPNDPRYIAMQKLVARGWTLQRIGDRYDLTRERVRQIVGNVGYERSQTSLNKLDANLDTVLARWADGASFAAISRETGVPLPAIRTLGLERNHAPIHHGTVTGYSRKCRCKECRAAHAARMRGYQRERIARGLCAYCPNKSQGRWRCDECMARLSKYLLKRKTAKVAA